MSDYDEMSTKAPSRLRSSVCLEILQPKAVLTNAVVMTSDELKSAEKRAEDAALEKENMRVAMTAQEQRAISTTYVLCILLTQPLTISTVCSVASAKLRKLHIPKPRLVLLMSR